MNASAVARIEPQDKMPSRASSIDDVLATALSQDEVDLDRVERFLALKREYEADEARKSYVAAMAQFKAEPLTIIKDKHVKFTTQKGTTEYDHATIGNVVNVICAALGKNGFSHRWDTKQDAGKITVTCIITHQRGHSESTTLIASPDDSGGKNGIQSIASTVTYLQRYTLLAATGMATSDQADDDGAGNAVQYVTDAQLVTLREWLGSTGADLPKFLAYLNIESLDKLPAKDYETALSALRAKAKAK